MDHSKRLAQLIERYRQDTGQRQLGVRELAAQMRTAGVFVSRSTLYNLLGGHTPDRSTLLSLAEFFEVSEYYFDCARPRAAALMDRIQHLDDHGLSAVEQLLTRLDGESEQAR